MNTKMDNIILIPTDFTEVCNNAVKHGAETAKFLNYQLCLLHVVDKDTKSYLKKENLTEEIIIEKLGLISNEVNSTYGIEVTSISREGHIFETISEVASEIGAKFIVMGTHGKVGMQKITGSYALKVITSSQVPVIVVQKRPFQNAYKDIVLPITSEAGPWDKTQWAASIAKQFDSCIHILKISDDEAINEAVKVITNYFDENKVKYFEKTAEKGTNFTKAVIDYAVSINSELIMILTSKSSALSNFILGAYDEDLIFNIPQIPVMCINPREVNWKKIVSY
jgi:nucleotide-binding universal stress UspA family protein